MIRIAVTYDNGQVFQHFGHTEQFKVYDVEEGKIVDSLVVDTNGQGHGALAQFLAEGEVDYVLCGGIGGGAMQALSEAGIKVFGGVIGKADECVEQLIAGTLEYDPEVHCDHHEHAYEEHECGGGCGSCGHHCG